MSHNGKVNGHDPKMQKILRELQDPQVQGILNLKRPVPPNRAAVRRQGVKSREEALRQLQEMEQRIIPFRAKTCAEWYNDELEEFCWGWVYRIVRKHPKWMVWFGIRTFAHHDADEIKGELMPTTVVWIKFFWKTIAINQYAWRT